MKCDICGKEAKLADSEEQVEFYKEENKINKKDCDYYFDEYTLCKQKIKDLEQENSELHTAINMSIPTQIAMRGEIERLYICIDDRIAESIKENDQLKQQLHDLPKKIVKEIRDVAGEYWEFTRCKECGNFAKLDTITSKDFDEILDIILKKFGEER